MSKAQPIIISLCFLLVTTLASGQNDKTVSKLKKADLIFKFDFGNLADINYPSIMVSAEHRLGLVSLSHEIGRIYDVAPNSYDEELEKIDYDDVFGFKFREEVRIYRPDSRKAGQKGFYMGLGWHYSFADIKAPSVVGYGCVDGRNCNYYESRDGTFKRRRMGFTFITGIESIAVRPFVLDVSMGIGAQRTSFSDPDDIHGAEVLKRPNLPGIRRYGSDFGFRSSNDNLYPMITLSLRAGFIIF